MHADADAQQNVTQYQRAHRPLLGTLVGSSADVGMGGHVSGSIVTGESNISHGVTVPTSQFSTTAARVAKQAITSFC